MLTLRLIGPEKSHIVDRLSVGAGSIPGDMGFIIFDGQNAGPGIPSKINIFKLFSADAMRHVVNGDVIALRFESGYDTDEVPIQVQEGRLMLQIDGSWRAASRTLLISFLPRQVQLKMLDDYKREQRKGAPSPQD